MESIGTQVFEKYGLAGLVFLFCGYIIWLVLSHFMKTVDRKDAQITEVTEKFTTALDANTLAMNESAKGYLQLANATANVVAGFDRAAAQSREEHASILDFVRRKIN